MARPPGHPLTPTAWHLIPLDDAPAWDAALDGIPHPVATTRAFRQAMWIPGGDPVSLFACEGPGSRFACAIAERSFGGEPDVYTPYGFGGVVGTGDPAVFRRAWTAAAEQLGWVASYVAQHPVVTPPGLAGDEATEHVGTAWVMDLDDGLQAVRARMSSNPRRVLRRYPEVEPRIAVGTPAVKACFRQTFHAFMAERDAPAVHHLPAAVLDALVAAEGTMVVGWPDDDPRIAALFGGTRWGSDFLFATEMPEARGMMAHVLWAAMDRLVDAGSPWLHLGGGVRGNDGVAEFKRRLGARPIPLPVRRIVHRRTAYDHLVALAERAGPPTRPDYFPAYHAPRRIVQPPS